MGIMATFLCTYLFAAVHECCHFLVAKSLGMPVKRFSFWLWGTGMVISPLLSPKKELLISAAGPAFHVVMIPVLFRFPNLRLINSTMLWVNLLPALPLDGGRIIKSALLSVLPVRTSRFLCRVMTYSVVLGLLIFVCLEVVGRKEPTAAFFLLFFLFLSLRRTDRENSLGVMLRLCGSKQDERSIGSVCFLKMSLPAAYVLRTIYIAKENIFFLIENGRVLGLISEDTVLSGLRKWGSAASLRKIFMQAVEK